MDDEEDDFHMLHTLTPVITHHGGSASSVNNISTEINNFMEKLKEMEWHLSPCAPSLQRQNIGAHNIYLPNSLVVPQHPQLGIPATTPTARSDHEILEEFDRLHSAMDFTEKLSSSQITLKLTDHLNHLATLQKSLIQTEINVYNRENQLAKNGSSKVTKSLEEIQKLCESFLNLYWIIQHQIDLLSLTEQNHAFSSAIENLKAMWRNILQNFLNANLIVEIQPPQVMKINTRFSNSVSLRFLTGSKLFTHNQTFLKANIISEAEARELYKGASCSNKFYKTSGILSNGISKFELNSEKCITTFKNLQLKKIDRKCKKVKGQQQSGSSSSSSGSKGNISSTDSSLAASVTDEKFCIHFHMEVKIGNAEFNVWTLSLPVVVVTHGIQESQAWATITWDNGFSSIQRMPFEVPSKVPWDPIAATLSSKFESSTGRGLEPHQLLTLKSKLLNEFNSSSVPVDQNNVTFSKFCKALVPGGTFPFWEWFYSALKLIEKHALKCWRSRAIYGFIGRSEAEVLLMGNPPGTFLLRFSDTVLGGVSICYVARNGHVYSITPFTSKHLSFRSLTDSIWDLENLAILYPNIPKELGFPRSVNTSLSSQSVGSPGTSSKTGVQTQQTAPRSGEPECHYVTSFPKVTLPTSHF